MPAADSIRIAAIGKERPAGPAGLTGPNFWEELVLLSIAAALLVHGLALLALRWSTPVIGMHAFRQTQTAITSYWMLKGSPWLAYETPVLGPPWSIPFEFPL